MGRAYFVRYMQALLLGRGDAETLDYIQKKVSFSNKIRYIHMELEEKENLWIFRICGLIRRWFF